jgi:flagellar hook-length control protein FliK
LDGLQPSVPSQPILSVPPQAVPVAAQAAATPSEAGDATPSTDQDSSATAAAGVDGRQPPSTLGSVAAKTAAPPASTPPRVADPSSASDTAATAVQRHLSAVTAETELAAATPAIPADAAPLPASALTAPPNAVPTPVGVAPHPAPAPPQAPPRPSAAGEPASPSAAVQVGPVLASFAAGAAHPGAPQHLTIRLDPMELGRVQVRIERLPDGSARVDLKVEKPDTLLLLLRDQPQLHRALDLAGVPSTERTLQFHLAPPDAPAPGSMTAQSNADHGHGQQRPGQPQSGRSAVHGPTPSLNEPISGPAAFRRAGVDITA